jgi:hypothetical protein
MIDVERGLRTISLSELTELLERRVKPITVDLPCIRVYAARAKTVMNRNGIRCGYVEVAFTHNGIYPDKTPTYRTMNAFPTTDSGTIYYDFGKKNFISEPTVGDREICHSKVPNIVPNPNDKGGGMSGSTLLGEYCNSEGIDYYMAKWHITNVRKIMDIDNNVKPSRYVDVQKFIKDFGKHEYMENKFECFDFAIKMRELANLKGIKCGVIMLYHREGNIPLNYLTDKSTTSHALNIFHTSDRGAFYVEPQMEGVMVDEPVIGGDYTRILNEGLKEKGVEYNKEMVSGWKSPYIVDRRIVIW